MRHICRTCKNKDSCQFYRDDRSDWVCGQYVEADNCQITLEDLVADQKENET